MAKRKNPLATVAEDTAAILADRPKPKPKRSKATYDLERRLVREVDEIARAESVTRSDVVAWALWELIRSYRAGEIDWTAHREHADRNPRATWKLVIPGDGGD